MPAPRYFIHVDAEITRRKRYHLITNEKAETVFRARLFHEIIDWLRDMEVDHAEIVALDARANAMLVVTVPAPWIEAPHAKA